ncbi:LytR/AlgR family response regulator transcription factor [Chitinophaga vietnamensis]|uniref:LytR/AlgR family response regulator transcription factor n=1 Tax=Chitinophaga vietnamensis TaxID=2593957 RepID=UPI0011786FFB|nr:response regulator [Chitinophaga vietnamensis]
MIKAIIIDDERNSRDIIALMLEKYCPQVSIAAMASDCADGISKIKEHQPQLVFLDLEMPDGTGFDILANTQSDGCFESIFVTAFEKKFLHVIRFSEVELILKPIDKESLLQAVNTITRRIEAMQSKQRYQVLMNNFNNSLPSSWKIVIPGANGEEYTITLPSIEYVESSMDKCYFQLGSGTYIQSARPFRYYADLFAGLKFFQINHQQLVQLSSIGYFSPDDGKIVLKSGTVLEIAERRRKDLIVRLHSNR